MKTYCKKCGHQNYEGIPVSFTKTLFSGNFGKPQIMCDVCDVIRNTEWCKKKYTNNPEKLKVILERREKMLEIVKAKNPKK
jgi:hypothetical protein